MIDVFHKDQSEPLSDDRKRAISGIKDMAQDLFVLIDGEIKAAAGSAKDSDTEGAINRCGAVAKTELETAIMWAVKGLTK